jgi:hypothetical protein
MVAVPLRAIRAGLAVKARVVPLGAVGVALPQPRASPRQRTRRRDSERRLPRKFIAPKYTNGGGHPSRRPPRFTAYGG